MGNGGVDAGGVESRVAEELLIIKCPSLCVPLSWADRWRDVCRGEIDRRQRPAAVVLAFDFWEALSPLRSGSAPFCPAPLRHKITPVAWVEEI